MDQTIRRPARCLLSRLQRRERDLGDVGNHRRSSPLTRWIPYLAGRYARPDQTASKGGSGASDAQTEASSSLGASGHLGIQKGQFDDQAISPWLKKFAVGIILLGLLAWLSGCADDYGATEQQRLARRLQLAGARLEYDLVSGAIVGVDFSDVPWSELWLEDLQRLPDLQSLVLTRTGITDAQLAELPVWPGLRRIVLTGNPVTDAGLGHLRKYVHLRELVLSFTHLTDPGLKELLCWRELEGLWLNGTQISDAGVSQLASLRQLRKLGLRETAITDVGLQSLATVQTLEELDVSDTRIKGACLKTIASLPRLRRLILNGTSVDEESLAVLGQCASLEELSLARTWMSDRGLAVLASLPNLKRLDLRGSRVSSRAAASWQKQHPQCNTLYLVWISPQDQMPADDQSLFPKPDLTRNY